MSVYNDAYEKRALYHSKLEQVNRELMAAAAIPPPAMQDPLYRRRDPATGYPTGPALPMHELQRAHMEHTQRAFAEQVLGVMMQPGDALVLRFDDGLGADQPHAPARPRVVFPWHRLLALVAGMALILGGVVHALGREGLQ